MKTSKSETLTNPSDGLKGLKKYWKSELISGFLVFLLAMPLSLGIAKASLFPAVYGIVTAIIGGLVVSFFMGSRISIKGPAAGLIVIVAGCVSATGDGEIGWKYTCAIICLASVLQIFFGVLKWGSLADYFPSIAVHGMLAAIGIIIMSKQINLLFGINPSELKGLDTIELLKKIPESIIHENTHLTEIGITCLILMFLLNAIPFTFIKKIPPPLIVLLVSVPLGILLHIKTEGEIQNYALVKIGNIGDIINQSLIKADFSIVWKKPSVVIQYIVLFSLIGSIESLLTAKAMDQLDPYKRKSNFNKDLWAVGIGNVLSGLLGGLPMISEVARSSANIGYGAKTRWSNFFHGGFLLLTLCFAQSIIEWIPNVALSAMLIYVGFKLTHPKSFVHVYKKNKIEFIVFISTILITLLTDLLMGVSTGIALTLIINWLKGLSVKNTFKCNTQIITTDKTSYLLIKSPLTFTNIGSLKKLLNNESINIKLAPHSWTDDTAQEFLKANNLI